MDIKNTIYKQRVHPIKANIFMWWCKPEAIHKLAIVIPPESGLELFEIFLILECSRCIGKATNQRIQPGARDSLQLRRVVLGVVNSLARHVSFYDAANFSG